MPNSNLSGYSTASKHAITMINAEMARKDAENAKKDALRDAELASKDAEMTKIKNQMADMLQKMSEFQQGTAPGVPAAIACPTVAPTVASGSGTGLIFINNNNTNNISYARPADISSG